MNRNKKAVLEELLYIFFFVGYCRAMCVNFQIFLTHYLTYGEWFTIEAGHTSLIYGTPRIPECVIAIVVNHSPNVKRSAQNLCEKAHFCNSYDAK